MVKSTSQPHRRKTATAPDNTGRPVGLNDTSIPFGPGGGATTEELVRRSNLWRDNYNPLRGLSLAQLLSYFESAERGDYVQLQLLLRKVEKRYPVLKALKARRLSALQKLDWSVQTLENLPAGATPEMAAAQKKFLAARYELIANLREAFGQIALAEFRGYAILQKHRYTGGPNDGAVEQLYWLEPWCFSRDGFYGDFYYNDTSRMGVGLGTCASILGEANRIGGASLPREDFIIRETDSPLYEIALIAFANWLMGRKDYAAFVEIFGLPNSVVIMPPNITPGKEMDYQVSAEKVSRGISGALPAGPGGVVTNTATATNSTFASTNLAPFTLKAAIQQLLVRPGSTDVDGVSPTVEFTTTTNASGADRGGMQFEGYSDANFPTPMCFIGHSYDPNGNSVRFMSDGSCRFDMGGGKFSCSPADFGIDQPGSVNGGFYYSSGAVSVGIGQASPAYNLDITGSFGDSSDGTYSMDSGGNLVCTTLTQTSDRALKEKIKPIASGAALAQILLLTNYEWNFKSRTNLINQASAVTNSVTVSNQVVKTVVLATNQIQKLIPAGEKQIGPMAQDWKAVTGLGDGRHISAIAFNGLLLGAVQDLATRLSTDEQYPRIPLYTPPSSSSTTFGYGPGLVTCDATNIYISTGTNSWRRLVLQGW